MRSSGSKELSVPPPGTTAFMSKKWIPEAVRDYKDGRMFIKQARITRAVV